MVLNGGYNVEVADAIPPRYECQICLLILRQPVQTLCGHRFCRICLNSLYDQQGGDIICPIDRKTVDMKTLFYDIAYEREILDISVKCSNNKSGCNWIGELRDLEDHIEIQCTRQKIQCQHENCSTMVFRRDLDGHIRNDCLYRTLNCSHCGDDYKYINEEYHESNCTRYPLPCNNNCGALQIPRDEIQEHLSKCPLTVVSCSFANVGCTIQFQRKMAVKHMKNHMHEHLHLTLVKTTKLETMYQEQRNLLSEYEKKSKTLESKCEEQRKLLSKYEEKSKTLETKCEDLTKQIATLQICNYQENSFIMTIENHSKKLEEEITNGKKLLSDPHIICGYKMRLLVSLNGYNAGKGTHMSVYFQLLRGEFDDALKWPFDKQVDVALIHQDNQEKSHNRLLVKAKLYKDNPVRPFQKPVTFCNIGWGCPTYVTLDKLYADGFIKNDTLYLRCFIKI